MCEGRRVGHAEVGSVVDRPNHFIVEAGLPIAETNQDSFSRLEHAGEIDAQLAARLRLWAGFRNDIDDLRPLMSRVRDAVERATCGQVVGV